jgi:magnesium-transporting ATPase (P-type)
MKHPLKKKKENEAAVQRDTMLLKSLTIVVNVLYALMIFQVFLILPRPDDPELQYSSLEQVYSDNLMVLLVIVIGLIMILIYWIQFHKLIGNLVRSSTVHASLAIFQMIFLMIYLYWLRFDMEFDGLTLALQMESIFLSLAGFTGALNWVYARRNKLTSDQIDEQEEVSILYSILPEPLAALFSLPFAVYGPGIWTLSFLVIIPIGMFLNWRKKKLYPET